MANLIERRGSTRHSTTNDPVIVQLMDRTGHRMTRARLANISTGGALILTDQAPVLNHALQVRLERTPETGWITAIPVRLGRSREVGLQFTRPCPPDFLWAATLGTPFGSVAASEEGTPDLGDTSTAPWAPSEENRWERDIRSRRDESRSEEVP
jgi:PilZ domain